MIRRWHRLRKIRLPALYCAKTNNAQFAAVRLIIVCNLMQCVCVCANRIFFLFSFLHLDLMYAFLYMRERYKCGHIENDFDILAGDVTGVFLYFLFFF